MPAEAIVCPTCGGADASRPDAHGLHTCQYCGVRYRITGGVAARLVAPPTTAAPPSRRTVLGRASVPPAPVDPPLAPIAAGSPAARGGSASVSVAAPGPTTATFELEHRRPSAGTSFYAIGWVTNTSAHAIDKPKVVVVLRDAAGKEVGTGFGFTEVDELAPGERVPISVLVQNPPAFATIDAEVHARPSSYARARVEGLRVEASAPKSDGFGTRVEGKVHHEGTAPARFVRIDVRAFDAQDKLLGLDTTYADAEVLAPGASARWQAFLLDYEAAAARFEFTVEAMPAAR
jgi:hypothetical protein